MRKIILLILFSITAFSQNRVNETLPKISKTNGILTTAKGWLKDNSGQWISQNNKIVLDLGSDTKTLGNYEKYSLGTDNFISFETKEVEIKGVKYMLLLKKYRDGFYDYETIEKGWHNQFSCKYYVITVDEFVKIQNINKDIENNLCLDLVCNGDLKYINLKTLTNDRISKEIAKEMKKYDVENYSSISYKLGLNISCEKNKNIVRFYFYDTLRYSGVAIYESDQPKPEPNDKYYVINYDLFNQFINIE